MVNCQTDALNWNGMRNWVDVWWVSLEMFVRACVNHIWYGKVWYGMEQWIRARVQCECDSKRAKKECTSSVATEGFLFSFFLSFFSLGGNARIVRFWSGGSRR